MERRIEDHFNKAGQRRHNEAWAGKLSAQKRTAALIRSSGAPVPAKLAKKNREDDVLSATETAFSVSGYSDKDWAAIIRHPRALSRSIFSSDTIMYLAIFRQRHRKGRLTRRTSAFPTALRLDLIRRRALLLR